MGNSDAFLQAPKQETAAISPREIADAIQQCSIDVISNPTSIAEGEIIADTALKGVPDRLDTVVHSHSVEDLPHDLPIMSTSYSTRKGLPDKYTVTFDPGIEYLSEGKYAALVVTSPELTYYTLGSRGGRTVRAPLVTNLVIPTEHLDQLFATVHVDSSSRLLELVAQNPETINLLLKKIYPPGNGNDGIYTRLGIGNTPALRENTVLIDTEKKRAFAHDMVDAIEAGVWLQNETETGKPDKSVFHRARPPGDNQSLAQNLARHSLFKSALPGSYDKNFVISVAPIEGFERYLFAFIWTPKPYGFKTGRTKLFLAFDHSKAQDALRQYSPDPTPSQIQQSQNLGRSTISSEQHSFMMGFEEDTIRMLIEILALQLGKEEALPRQLWEGLSRDVSLRPW